MKTLEDDVHESATFYFILYKTIDYLRPYSSLLLPQPFPSTHKCEGPALTAEKQKEDDNQEVEQAQDRKIELP